MPQPKSSAWSAITSVALDCGARARAGGAIVRDLVTAHLDTDHPGRERGPMAISYPESVLGYVEYDGLPIVGAASAGTNGNVKVFALPGRGRVAFTGMKVTRHDGSQHHLLGVRPTIPAAPTDRRDHGSARTRSLPQDLPLLGNVPYGFPGGRWIPCARLPSMDRLAQGQRHVLIVEDDRMTALVISQYLEAHGFRTTIATNGVDGLSKFLSELPDLALVDVLLPRKNGFEVCFEMKHSEHGRSTPVVMMSAVYRNTHSAGTRAQGVKADGFMLKPFDLDEMVSRVNELIGGS